MEENYGEARGVRLPIKEEASGFLSYDATLTLKIKEQALGAHYQTSGADYQAVGYLHTGSKSSGEIVMEVGRDVHRFKFEGQMSLLFVVSYSPKRPSDEPFKMVLKDGNGYVRQGAAEASDKLDWKPETVDGKVACHMLREGDRNAYTRR